MTPFNTVYHRTIAYKRYGLRWTDEEKNMLTRLFLAGADIGTICARLERPPEGVTARLLAQGLIAKIEGLFFRTDTDPEPTKEHMDTEIAPFTTFGRRDPTTLSSSSLIEGTVAFQSQPNFMQHFKGPAKMENIKNITLIDGQDAASLKDDAIFKKIAKLEQEVAAWKTIENKPKKLQLAIDKLQEDIKALVAYVDER